MVTLLEIALQTDRRRGGGGERREREQGEADLPCLLDLGRVVDEAVDHLNEVAQRPIGELMRHVEGRAPASEGGDLKRHLWR